ncbi:MAG: ROK family transcriptional regulator [Anaerolineaceae bacterium]|nr:ROK family transcriptional regulator [Anaerolineaceae bacterium]
MKKATRNQTKAHNRKLILNIIYEKNNLSRADVARITGLTRTTVSDIVYELIAEGLVDEIGLGKSSGGKPPTLLGINKNARNILSVDLASGEFRGAIINLRGEIKYRAALPIEDPSGDAALDLVYELIDQLIKLADFPILGIGIGSPGLMNAEEGIVRTSVNLAWKDLPLVYLLKERYKKPVYIANDCQVSALAENCFGNFGHVNNLVLIKIGQGVGAGIVINQQLFHGDGFGAGEIGHVKVEENGELCACGNYGCLETRISSRSIRKRALQAAKEHPDCILNQIASNPNKIRMHEVIAAFQSGDPYIAKIVQEVSKDLAKAISFLITAINVHRIVIAGSISDFNEGLVEPIVDYLQASVLHLLLKDTEVVTSTLGIDIVLLGSAAMVLQNELGIFQADREDFRF